MEMARSPLLLIFCGILFSVLDGYGGLAIRNADFSEVLTLLNENHEAQQPVIGDTEFDETDVETRDLVIPSVQVPEVIYVQRYIYI